MEKTPTEKWLEEQTSSQTRERYSKDLDFWVGSTKQ